MGNGDATREEIQRLERQAEWHNFAAPIDRLRVQPGWRVVDVGCGSGVVSRLLAQRATAGLVVGLDVRPEHAAAARALAADRGIDRVAFLAGDARRLPFADHTFDLLWSSFVVEFLAAEIVPVLREFARVVRPGGIVAVFEVDGFLLHHDPIDPDLARRIARWHAAVRSWGFDPEIGHRLPEHFARAGLIDVQTETFPDPELYPSGRPPDAILGSWRRRLAGMRGLARALGSPEEAERFRSNFLALLARPDLVTRGANWLVWGRRSRQ